MVQVNGRTVLELGGCRVTVVPASTRPSLSQRLMENVAESTPNQWQLAEAEIQQKTHMPFEPPSRVRTDRISFLPRVGGTYRAVAGTDVEIARVVGRDGALWIVVDVNDRPIVLKRVELKWHALPRDRTSPVVGDVILHPETQSIVTDVLGEVQVGGWAVKSAEGALLHVLRGEVRHWMAVGEVEAA